VYGPRTGRYDSAFRSDLEESTPADRVETVKMGWKSIMRALLRATMVSLGVVLFSFSLAEVKLVYRVGFDVHTDNLYVAAFMSIIFITVVAGIIFIPSYLDQIWTDRRDSKRLIEKETNSHSYLYAQKDSRLKLKKVLFSAGRIILDKILSQARDGSQPFQSDPYALLLRPFVWDIVGDQYCITVDPRVLASYLKDRRYGFAVLDSFTLRGSRPGLYTSMASALDFNEKLSRLFYTADDIKIQLEELLGLFVLDNTSAVGFGDSSYEQSDLGIAYEYSTEQQWENDILFLMQHASVVFLIPWDSPGALWELDCILKSPDIVAKTILLLPGRNMISRDPYDRPDVQARQSEKLTD
jgi:hypothetical protein